ncbi:MAG TPA: hypothetical protein VF530_11530 [Planctomycetota bacterium]
MVSRLELESRPLDEQRVLRALPALHQLTLASALLLAWLAGWFVHNADRIWTPWRGEIGTLAFLASVAVAVLAMQAARSLAPFHPRVRLAAPLAPLGLLAAILAAGIELDPISPGVLSILAGYLLGLLLREGDAWRLMGRRRHLALELAVRPTQDLRRAQRRIESPELEWSTQRRRALRALALLSVLVPVGLLGLHLARRVPDLRPALWRFSDHWNARDSAALGAMSLFPTDVERDLERFAALPGWPQDWPSTTGVLYQDEPEVELSIAGEEYDVWGVKFGLHEGRALPVRWILVGSEWRVYSLGQLGSFTEPASSRRGKIHDSRVPSLERQTETEREE